MRSGLSAPLKMDMIASYWGVACPPMPVMKSPSPTLSFAASPFGSMEVTIALLSASREESDKKSSQQRSDTPLRLAHHLVRPVLS